MHPPKTILFTGYGPTVAGCHLRRPCCRQRSDLGCAGACCRVIQASLSSQVVSVAPPGAVVVVMSQYGRHAGPRFAQLEDDFKVWAVYFPCADDQGEGPGGGRDGPPRFWERR